MDEFLFEVDLGLPHDALFLAEFGLSRDEIMTVLGAGITSKDVLDAMRDEDLRRRVGSEIANRLRRKGDS